jgi:hypothetical protein
MHFSSSDCLIIAMPNLVSAVLQYCSSTVAVQASQLPCYARTVHLWLAMDQVRTVDNIQNKRYEMVL